MFGSLLKNLRRGIPDSTHSFGRYGWRVWEVFELLIRRARLTEAEAKTLRQCLSSATYLEKLRGHVSLLDGRSLAASFGLCERSQLDPFEAALRLVRARLNELKFDTHVSRVWREKGQSDGELDLLNLVSLREDSEREEAEFLLLHRIYQTADAGASILPLEILSAADSAEIAYRIAYENALNKGADKEEASRQAWDAAEAEEDQ